MAPCPAAGSPAVGKLRSGRKTPLTGPATRSILLQIICLGAKAAAFLLPILGPSLVQQQDARSTEAVAGASSLFENALRSAQHSHSL